MKQRKEFEFGANCFDIIRLVSAVLIVIGHTTQHLKVSVHLPGWDITGMWIGLFCLFTISGYLIPASLERSAGNKEFLIKRFVRLYPELWVALAVSLGAVLIIGRRYNLSYNITDIFKWLAAQLTVFQFYTPGTIEAYGVGNPNGSLWTISMEIQIYFAIMLMWKWIRKRSMIQWLCLIGGAVMINIGFAIAYNAIPGMIAKLINVTFIPYAYVFLIGMFCYAYRERIIPLISQNFLKIALAYYIWHSLNVLVFRVDLGHYSNVISGIFVSVLTMSGAYYFGKIRLKRELSYGLYIYHMIVINALVMFGWEGKWICVPVVLCISYVLAYFSSRFVEKPAMKIIHGGK